MISPRLSADAISKIALQPGDTLSIINAQKRFTYWSDSSASDVHVQSVLGASLRDYIHPHDLYRVEHAFNAVFTKEAASIPPYRFRNLAGEYRWVDTKVVNMMEDKGIDGYILKSTDITEKLKAEEREKRLKSYYKSLFHNHPDAVFRVNIEGRIQEVNKGALHLFGVTESEALGSRFFDLVIPAEADKVASYFSKAVAGEAVSYQTVVTHRDGYPLALNVALVPVVIDNKVVRVQGIAQDMSQINRANALIRQQAEIQANIFESISEGFFSLDHQWCYTYVNSICAEFVQRTKDELLNRNILKCFPVLKNSLFKRKCEEVFASGKPVDFIECFPGREVTLSFNIYKTAFGVAVHFTDITEQLIDQENIEKLSMVAGKVTNGVLLLDGARNVQWVNESFTRLTKYGFRDVVGKNIETVLPENPVLNKLSFLRLLSMLKKAQPSSQDINLCQPDGTEVWLSSTITPVIEEGQVKYYILVLSDITAKKEAELSLVKHAEELYKQNRDLEQFTYIVSHNLRAPIASALGCADLITSIDKNDPLFDEFVKGLYQSIAKLDKVVTDMNTILSVRDRAKAELKESVNLHAKCSEIYDDIHQLLEENKARFVIDIHENLFLNYNPAYIYSILYNLITNAIKYKSKYRYLSIELSARVNRDNELVISVRDNGIGMDMEKVKDKIFKLYSRFNTKVDGEGMGLFLVKTQVEALGGRIEVKSQVNRGSCFFIYFKDFGFVEPVIDLSSETIKVG